MPNKPGTVKLVHDVMLAFVVMGMYQAFFVLMVLYNLLQDRDGLGGGAFDETLGHLSGQIHMNRPITGGEGARYFQVENLVRLQAQPPAEKFFIQYGGTHEQAGIGVLE
jgi:hypothetical protein